jgi:hypothetical protein
VSLKERGGGRTDGAEIEVVDAGRPCDRFQNALEEVADTISRAGRRRKQERLGIGAPGMRRNPGPEVAGEFGRQADPGVGCLRLGLSNALLTLFPFFTASSIRS